MNVEDLLKQVFNSINNGKVEEAQTQVEENRSEFGDIFGQLSDLFQQKNETTDHDVFGNLTDLFKGNTGENLTTNVSADPSDDLFGKLKDLLGDATTTDGTPDTSSSQGDFLTDLLKKITDGK